MRLSDGGILKAMKKGRLNIEPFNEKNLTPNGYDVSIQEVEVKGNKIKPNNDEMLLIPSKTDFIVLTREKITTGNDVSGNLWLKTKYARKGIILSAGVDDAGFAGQLNLCCYNSSDSIVELKDGCTFVQLVFDVLDKPARKLYAERSGNYQNQNSIRK